MMMMVKEEDDDEDEDEDELLPAVFPKRIDCSYRYRFRFDASPLPAR